ncbi:MAG: hypothetical protein A2X72_09620 [Burkholderiales bacterium GWF1_66_17]|nr:MAG: hypothetical protein A2X73_16335 [Burkholderiales bacterium GWE1_65_30]OGA89634.1 MAG: hypothetical protein A2X72_09620 [Burkholderiales bacterium GWF1_66_17]
MTNAIAGQLFPATWEVSHVFHTSRSIQVIKPRLEVLGGRLSQAAFAFFGALAQDLEFFV